MPFTKRRPHRLLVLAVLILLVLTASFAARQLTGKRLTCPGLSCYDDSDCGSKCVCQRSTGAHIGKCVSK